jgi:Xaa-Pro aminopeptidase
MQKMWDRDAWLTQEWWLVKRAKLIIAASETSADMLYATRFRAPDAFVFLEVQGRTSILLSDLEVDRGRREAGVDEVVSYSQIEKELIVPKRRSLPSPESWRDFSGNVARSGF